MQRELLISNFYVVKIACTVQACWYTIQHFKKFPSTFCIGLAIHIHSSHHVVHSHAHKTQIIVYHV